MRDRAGTFWPGGGFYLVTDAISGQDGGDLRPRPASPSSPAGPAAQRSGDLPHRTGWAGGMGVSPIVNSWAGQRSGLGVSPNVTSWAGGLGSPHRDHLLGPCQSARRRLGDRHATRQCAIVEFSGCHSKRVAAVVGSRPGPIPGNSCDIQGDERTPPIAGGAPSLPRRGRERPKPPLLRCPLTVGPASIPRGAHPPTKWPERRQREEQGHPRSPPAIPRRGPLTNPHGSCEAKPK